LYWNSHGLLLCLHQPFTYAVMPFSWCSFMSVFICQNIICGIYKAGAWNLRSPFSFALLASWNIKTGYLKMIMSWT
jgi:hypothetical protein